MPVVIDARGRAIHGYLHYLVHGAVSYTEVLDIDPRRAGVLAALCFGIWTLLFAAGLPLLTVPFVGAGGIIGAYVGLYWLSVRGHPLSLTRTPIPADRYR